MDIKPIRNFSLVFSALICLIIVFALSCDTYNEDQKRFIRTIEQEYYFIKRPLTLKFVIDHFSKNEIIKLTSHSNVVVRTLFFEVLAQHYPEESFAILLKHLTDQAIISEAYSDVIDSTVSVAENMIKSCGNANSLTLREKEELKDEIILNFEKYKHLKGFSSYILYSSQPQEKYYNKVRKAVFDRKFTAYEGSDLLLDYLYRFQKAGDLAFIKNSLDSLVEVDKPGDAYTALEIIKRAPNEQFYKVLMRNYNKTINGQSVECDVFYCDLAHFLSVIVKYPNGTTLKILNSLYQRTDYQSTGRKITNKEEIYWALKNADNPFYDSLLSVLSDGLDVDSLDQLQNSKNRRFSRPRNYWN